MSLVSSCSDAIRPYLPDVTSSVVGPATYYGARVVATAAVGTALFHGVPAAYYAMAFLFQQVIGSQIVAAAAATCLLPTATAVLVQQGNAGIDAFSDSFSKTAMACSRKYEERAYGAASAISSVPEPSELEDEDSFIDVSFVQFDENI